MAWRSLHISQSAKLSLQQGQLSVEKFLAGKQPPKEKIGTAQLILLSISSAFFILHQAITAVGS